MTNFLSGKKKILTMILGIVSGLAIAFGLEPNEVNVIAGAVVAVVSAASYLIVEGRIDVERIRNAAQAVDEVLAFYREPEEGIENTEETVTEDEEEHDAEPDETGRDGDPLV